MMKKLLAITAIVAIALTFSACKKKMKDADIKSAVETALRGDPMAVNTQVSVDKGIVTISGECKDQACKDHCGNLVKDIKGVKSVVNNCTVAPAPPPPVVNTGDDALKSGLTDALKDHPGVQFSVNEGKIVLTGEIAKAKWQMLKQTLDKLMSKGYDLSGLKIK
jgi:hyperosmotically inducible periplasmic protein